VFRWYKEATARIVNISESDGAVLIRTSHKHPIAISLIASAIATAFVEIALWHFVRPLLLLSLSFVVASLAFLGALRRTKAELRVTKFDLRTTGYFGRDFQRIRSVPSADVCQLEYQEDTTGPESSDHPGGLYAVLGKRSVCILPYIDEEQTARVIESIEKKFPELGRHRTETSDESPLRGHFVSLNIESYHS
jgi:hypothetical protein